MQLPQEFFPQPGDLFWTPADWAWIGGLLDVLLPSLYCGVPVLASRARKFDPEAAFDLMARHRVRNVFLPPTALKLMRQVQNPRRFGYAMRSIGSGGETLGADMLDWSRETFGFAVNEFYGQTEANLLVANCAEPVPGQGRARWAAPCRGTASRSSQPKASRCRRASTASSRWRGPIR